MTTTTGSSESNYKIGVDIGGAKISAVLLRRQEVVESCRLATPTDNLNNFLNIFRAVIAPLIERAATDKTNIDFLGVGVPGTVNARAGRIFNCANLPILNDVKLLNKLRDDLKLSWTLKLNNDVNCFTLAEARLGAGVGYDNVFGFTLGTGIGGGWCLNGQIYQGAHGNAGEIGGMLIDLDKKITLEEAYKKLTQNNPRLLAQEAYEGDVLAEKSFQELGAYLGLALANVVNVLDPAVIVVGGGASAASDLFLNIARKTMKKHLRSAEAKKTVLTQSKLGDNAGAIGAALIK